MRHITKNVLVLGWVSFLTDVSSEMILPILPLFLVTTLGVGQASVGLIEGVADATASFLKGISGWFSDRLGRRRFFVVSGYVLSSAVRPIVALTTSWAQVLGVRFLDRMGKGIRSAPRDALIADSSSAANRGRSFGFHRSMDTAGAVVGSLIAFGILSFKTDAFRTIFGLSAVPGFLSVLALCVFLREPKNERRAEISTSFQESKTLGKGFFRFLVLIVLLTLGQLGYAFALLRANGIGISIRMVPLIYLVYNVVYSVFSMPAGILSDRWGRVQLLAWGILLNILLTVGMAFVETPLFMVALFIVYGLVSSIYETIPRALASDLAPRTIRGTGFGFYHTVVGITALPASFFFGFLWEHVHVRAAFVFSSGVSLVAFLWLVLFFKGFLKNRIHQPDRQHGFGF